MKRRSFITLLGGAAALPLAARAQQPDRIPRIGVLMGVVESLAVYRANLGALREGLQALGWTDGRNVRIDTRWAAPGNVEALQLGAKELVAMQPDLILSHTTPTTATLLQQTRSIPIIFVFVTDPLGSGFVASFSHPGGNVTGFIVMEPGVGRQVAGTAQGDCAARLPGRFLVQPHNGALCRILAEALQSRGRLFRSGGDRGARP
jgi:putative tryptophan/tyrosine transport system substrate-binding protein